MTDSKVLLDSLKGKIYVNFAEDLQGVSSPSALFITYFDADLGEAVLLDVYSWEEFMAQSKKALELTLLPTSKETGKGATANNIIAIDDVDVETIESNTTKIESPQKQELVVKSTNVTNSLTHPFAVFKENPTLGKEENNEMTIEQIMATPEKHLNGKFSFQKSLHEFAYEEIVYPNGERGVSMVSVLARQRIMDSKNTNPLSNSSDNGAYSSDGPKHTIWYYLNDGPISGSIVTHVNGINISNLEKDFQLALIKQKKRPLSLTFEVQKVVKDQILNTDMTNLPQDIEGIQLTQLTNSADIGKKEGTLPYSLFLNKYAHSSATKLRKQVKKLLKDYTSCDWVLAKNESAGKPQDTIRSLYLFVEQELKRLGLLDGTKPQGKGAPMPLTDEHIEDLRNYIENFVFMHVSTFTKTLWPIYSEGLVCAVSEGETVMAVLSSFVDNLIPTKKLHNELKESTSVVPTLDANEDYSPALSTDPTMYNKFAFLRFATLEQLGLQSKHSKKNKTSDDGDGNWSGGDENDRVDEENDDSSMDSDEKGFISAFDRKLNHVSSRSRNFDDPYRGMWDNKFLLDKEEWYVAVKAIHRAMQFDTASEILQKLVNACRLLSKALQKLLNGEYTSNRVNLCCSCGRLHFTAKNPSGTIDVQTDAIFFGEKRDKDVKSVGSVHDQTVPPIADLPQALLDSDQLLSYDSRCGQNNASMSADELIPVITWAVIQANPPNIDCIVWLCEEFRHPSLLRGEEAFCLTQLASAVEFCRSASHKSFDLPKSEYKFHMMRYNSLLKLLIACKQGNLTAVRDLVGRGVDINGLSPDLRDTPLTASIRFHNISIIRLLLNSPGIEIDSCIHYYRGRHQRCTALFIAVEEGLMNVVLELLQNGANRYHQDDAGKTPLDIAIECGEIPIGNVLLANPKESDLIQCVLDRDLSRVQGLLYQSVEVNYLRLPEKLLTPLIAAVKLGVADFVKVILQNSSTSVDVDLKNNAGETALICVARAFKENSLSDYALITAMLLRAGANRYLLDKGGQSALSLINSLVQADQTAVFSHQPSVDYSGTNNVPVDLDIVRTSQNDFENDSYDEDTSSLSMSKDNQVLESSDRIMVIRTMSALLQCDPFTGKKIYEYAKNGDFFGVQALLYQGVDVNEACPVKHYTALIAAVFNRDVKMVELLLKADEIAEKTQIGRFLSDGLVNVPMKQSNPYSPLGKDSEKSDRQTIITSPLNLDLAGKGGMTALHYAAQAGLSLLVGRLLKAGAQRDLKNAKGHTPVDVALANGHKICANVLRFDPEKVSICLAAKHGDISVMEALLCQGVSINAKKDHTGAGGFQHDLYTPLIAACAYRQTELITAILTIPQVDLNIQNKIGMTALMYAASHGDEQVVLSLLSKKADRYLQDINGYDASRLAAKNEHESLSVLLYHDPQIVFIHDVIRRNEYAAVISMFKQSVDPNYVRNINDSKFNSEEVKLLWKTSAVKEDTRLQLYDRYKVSRKELIDGETPLIVAAAYNRMDVLKLLLRAPEIKPDMCDVNRRTALYHGAIRGHEEIVLVLLKAGASRYLPDKFNVTAKVAAAKEGYVTISALIEADPRVIHIHDACHEGKLLLVNALLKQGCPPTYRDERQQKQHQTPLMAACSGGSTDVVRMLLRIPAVDTGKDAVDDLGRTALMRAAGKGALDITGMLLNAGVDRNLKDNEGLTARDHAARHSYTVMFQFVSQNIIR